MELGQVLTFASPVLIAIVTAYFGYLAIKKKGSVDALTVLNEGHRHLIDQLQEERTMFAAETLRCKDEMNSREVYVRRLLNHIYTLEGHLRFAKIKFKPLNGDAALVLAAIVIARIN